MSEAGRPDLSASACELLQPSDLSLIEQFNHARAAVADLVKKFPHLKTTADEHWAKLEHVRGLLTRSYYRVGFLGTTGCGKSTTFNNILEVAEDDRPARAGKGDATTSAVSRLRRTKDETCPNTIYLHYLTEEQYRRKRDALCQAVGVGVGLTDAEVLEQIPTLRAAVESGERGGRETDLKSLDLLIRSYQKYGGTTLKKHPDDAGRPGEWDKREEYVNHADARGLTPQPSTSLLLREAEIHFRTTKIPHQLEMFDLPGLGSRGTIDTLLTIDFLAQLDGIILFLRADQLSDQNAEQILENLRRHWGGKVGARVWVVATKFDGLTAEHFKGTTNWFDSLLRFLKEHSIPIDHLTIVSNEVVSLLHNPTEGVPPELLPNIALKRPPTAHEATLARLPQFRAQLEGVYRDGGIGRLRELLVQELAEAVRHEILADAVKKITDVERTAKRDLELAVRRAKANKEEALHALKCFNAVDSLLNELAARPDYVRRQATKLRGDLTKHFQELKPNNIETKTLKDLAETHTFAGEQLDDKLRALLEGEILTTLFGEVAKQLQNLPKVAVIQSDSPIDAWLTFQDQDLTDKTWLDRLPTFRDEHLFRELLRTENRLHGFDGRAYLDYMEEKIRLVTAETVHAVRVRLKYRLQQIERELKALMRPETRTESSAHA